MMHLSVSEAALAGATITALAGTLGGVVVQRATRTRDHLARIWEREAEVYEWALLVSNSWSSVRKQSMATLDSSKKLSIAIAQSEIDTDSPTQRRLMMRLVMFGAPQVKEVWQSCTSTHLEWMRSFNLLANTYKMETGDQDKTMKLRKDVRQANKVANKTEWELMDVVKTTIRRVPKRVRIWQELSISVGRYRTHD
jgi:hypothetical protein